MPNDKPLISALDYHPPAADIPADDRHGLEQIALMLDRRGNAHASTAKLRDNENFVTQVVTQRASQQIATGEKPARAAAAKEGYSKTRKRAMTQKFKSKPISSI